MIRLEIPYRSQWDKKEANHYNADCGPTCAAMILNYHNIASTPNSIYAENFPNKEIGDFTTFNELIRVFRKHQVGVEYRLGGSKPEALRQLRANMDAGKPMIALVRYQPWRSHAVFKQNQFNGGHFVVVTGYDEAHIYMHDPLFGLWVKPASQGAHFPMPVDLFCAGWAGFEPHPNGNPNWAYLLLSAAAATAVQTTPPTPPAVETAAAATPSQTAQPAANKTMQDINRRIRALAAFRWAVEPNFADETAVALWREHLGDWGLTYREHTVQPGDSYTGLANQYFGESHRWPAIRAYNDLAHDGLWVGETIRVPDLGQSGAHLNSALPSDTANFAKSISLEALADPDENAMDYDALWDDSVNLAYVAAEES